MDRHLTDLCDDASSSRVPDCPTSDFRVGNGSYTSPQTSLCSGELKTVAEGKKQMLSNKRRRGRPPKRPRNKYSQKRSDIQLLASLYPSFRRFVKYSKSGLPIIDCSDFNANRELTRVLLLHDHGVHWSIPDGLLCPIVSNRLNYLHWIADLLSSEMTPKKEGGVLNGKIRGLDIGTGANCIFPLLGASLYQWSFVGSNITEVALEWARKNVESNPHLSELIEIRHVPTKFEYRDIVSSSEGITDVKEVEPVTSEEDEAPFMSFFHGVNLHREKVLAAVVRDGEEFDFCMCHPPFFNHMERADFKPWNACGGSYDEMVYPGGELSFIDSIIEDSMELKHKFRWFTSVVGRRGHLNMLECKLRENDVPIVRVTEFGQDRTARWGLAWSFLCQEPVQSHVPAENSHSFTVEGLERQFGAIHVLKETESFFHASSALCECYLPSLFICVNFPSKKIGALLHTGDISHTDSGSSQDLHFCVSVCERIPGSVVVSSLSRGNTVSEVFVLLVRNLEEHLKKYFIKNNGNRKIDAVEG